MGRLTTNKNVSEMSMMELAHNSCYAKDRKARYRDYDRDIDVRELTKQLLEKFADIPTNEFTSDEDFEEFMHDSLQYGTQNILGLIALFYRNLWAMANIRERLKEYEDMEEEGKLLKIPCKVGDTVYTACSWGIETGVVGSIEIMKDHIFVNNIHGEMIGKADNIFLTREKAEEEMIKRYKNKRD